MTLRYYGSKIDWVVEKYEKYAANLKLELIGIHLNVRVFFVSVDKKYIPSEYDNIIFRRICFSAVDDYLEFCYLVYTYSSQ